MIRFTALAAAALISANLAAPAQAERANGVSVDGLNTNNGWGERNGVTLNGLASNGLASNGLGSHGLDRNNGAQPQGPAGATNALLQGMLLPNGLLIAR